MSVDLSHIAQQLIRKRRGPPSPQYDELIPLVDPLIEARWKATEILDAVVSHAPGWDDPQRSQTALYAWICRRRRATLRRAPAK